MKVEAFLQNAAGKLSLKKALAIIIIFYMMAFSAFRTSEPNIVEILGIYAAIFTALLGLGTWENNTIMTQTK